MARQFMPWLFQWRRPDPPPPAGGIGIAELRQALREEIMEALVPLQDEIAALTADDEALEAEVEAAIGVLNGIPGVVAAAVASALANAGVDTAAQEQALAAVDAAVKAETAKLSAVLNPTPPAPPASTLTVSPPSLSGAVGQLLAGTLSVTGGTAPYTFSSDLADVTVDGSGNYAGTPAAAENGTIRVNDSATPPGLFKVPVAIS